MKRANVFFYSLIMLIFTSTHLFSQTEVWRRYDLLDYRAGAISLQRSGQGNIIINGIGGTSGAGRFGTKKINASGQDIWSISPHDSLGSLSDGGHFTNGDGTFIVVGVIPQHSVAITSIISYYDSTDTFKWSQQITARRLSDFSYGIRYIDRAGNFILAYNISDSVQVLTKFTKDGEMFHTQFPTIDLKGLTMVGFKLDGTLKENTVEDESGILHIFRWAHKSIGKSNSSSEERWLYNSKYDPVSNSFIGTETQLMKMFKGSSNNSGDKAENFEALKLFKLSSNNYVFAGTNEVFGTKVSSSMSKSDYKNLWQVVSVINGKQKKFNYKGKGGKIEIGTNVITKTFFNWVEDAALDNEQNLYLVGSVQNGLLNDGEGDTQFDGVLLKYNLAEKKVKWKKFFSGERLWRVLVNKNGVVFLQKLGNINDGDGGDNKLFVFDKNGNESNPLVFPFSFNLYNNSFLEDGYLYVCEKESINAQQYLAKYALPAMKFTPNSNFNESVTSFSLEQNYPNPFNPQTVIGFSLLDVGNVTLKIYNVLGQEVATLLNNEAMEEGEHEIQFDASRLTSGVYFYRINVERSGASFYTSVKKMMLMK